MSLLSSVECFSCSVPVCHANRVIFIFRGLLSQRYRWNSRVSIASTWSVLPVDIVYDTKHMVREILEIFKFFELTHSFWELSSDVENAIFCEVVPRGTPQQLAALVQPATLHCPHGVSYYTRGTARRPSTLENCLVSFFFILSSHSPLTKKFYPKQFDLNSRN